MAGAYSGGRLSASLASRAVLRHIRGMTTCKAEARRWVHRYAAGGGAFAALPIVGTSSALATIEMHMMGIIGDIYGESVSGVTTAAAGGTFAVMGQGLKWIAFRASQ